MDIAAAMLFHDQTPDQIAAAYELSLAQVYAALAYYYAHKAEIDTAMREDSALVKAFKDRRAGG